MFRYTLLLSICFSFLSFFQANAQVWPGDITDNGEVNSVDVLYWAIANGSNGPQRPQPSLLWNAQAPGNSWTQDFPDGQNFSYGDCNGDGLIDLVDLIVIQLNQDSAHAPYLGEDFSTGIQGIDPPLWLGTDEANQNISAILGAEVEVGINLGSQDIPVENFSGLAFQVFIDTSFIGEINPMLLQGPEDWLAEESAIVTLNVDQQFEQAEKHGIDVAWYLFEPDTRLSGFGQIGKLNFIIEEDLTLLQEDTTISISIVPVRMVNQELTTLNISGDTIDLTIYRDSTVLLLATDDEIEPTEAPRINVYPNPVDKVLNIDLPDTKVESIQIFNTFNHIVYHQPLAALTEHLIVDISNLPPGTYWVKAIMETGRQVHTKFIKISPD
jgi:hypothetical protein